MFVVLENVCSTSSKAYIKYKAIQNIDDIIFDSANELMFLFEKRTQLFEREIFLRADLMKVKLYKVLFNSCLHFQNLYSGDEEAGDADDHYYCTFEQYFTCVVMLNILISLFSSNFSLSQKNKGEDYNICDNTCIKTLYPKECTLLVFEDMDTWAQKCMTDKGFEYYQLCKHIYYHVVDNSRFLDIFALLPQNMHFYVTDYLLRICISLINGYKPK